MSLIVDTTPVCQHVVGETHNNDGYVGLEGLNIESMQGVLSKNIRPDS